MFTFLIILKLMFIKKLKVLTIQGLLTVLCLPGYTQAKDYNHEMLSLYKNINTYFFIDSLGYYKEKVMSEKGERPVSFLWPLCALLQADNEMEKILPKKVIAGHTFKIIKKYFNQFPPAPGYASYSMELGGGSRFYDDNQWIGIAAMDAFNRTKEPGWLHTGKEIYRFMMTAYDSAGGGGLYWQEGNKKTKNTCSNGPGIILALQLYQATKEKSYLDTALLLYNWVNANLQSPTGLYYDNINLITKVIDRRLYSYNTGTMLQSAIYLYECTNDSKYLKQATAIAESSVPFFLANNKFKDDYWFCAVLLRGYQHLLKHNKELKYIKAFKACLDEALTNNKNATGLMGNKKVLSLVPQAGMLEILARFAWLQEQLFFN